MLVYSSYGMGTTKYSHVAGYQNSRCLVWCFDSRVGGHWKRRDHETYKFPSLEIGIAQDLRSRLRQISSHVFSPQLTLRRPISREGKPISSRVFEIIIFPSRVFQHLIEMPR